MRMCSLSRICMLIQMTSVKTCKAVQISWEMSRYPIKYYSDSLLMQIVYKVHEIIRCTVSACRTVIPCHLIAPTCIKRMLHYRHNLHMSIIHLLYVNRKFMCYLTIIIEYRAVYFLTVLIILHFFSYP